MKTSVIRVEIRVAFLDLTPGEAGELQYAIEKLESIKEKVGDVSVEWGDEGDDAIVEVTSLEAYEELFSILP